MAKPAKPKEHVNKYKLVPISEPRKNAADLVQKLKLALPPEHGKTIPLVLEGEKFIDKFVFYLSKATPELLSKVEKLANTRAQKEKITYKEALGKELSILIARLGLK